MPKKDFVLKYCFSILTLNKYLSKKLENKAAKKIGRAVWILCLGKK